MDTILFSFEQLQIGSTKYFLEEAKKHRENPGKYWAFCANGILNSAILLEIYVTWFIRYYVETRDEDEFFNQRPGFKAKWDYAHKHFRDVPDSPLLPAFDAPELENIRKTVDARNTIVHYTKESIADLLSEKQLELAIQSIYEIQEIFGRWHDFFKKRPNDYILP